MGTEELRKLAHKLNYELKQEDINEILKDDELVKILEHTVDIIKHIKAGE